MTIVKTGEAARALGVSPNTLRSWERRCGYPKPVRSAGQHRGYDRITVLAMRDAMREGLLGRSMLDRAKELESSPRYREPASLRERMDRLEIEMRRLRLSVERALVDPEARAPQVGQQYEHADRNGRDHQNSDDQAAETPALQQSHARKLPAAAAAATDGLPILTG